MRTITLRRLTEDTFGQLESEDGTVICVTLEEPWRDENHDGLSDKNVSRIPAGTFPMFRRLSPSRGYELFELRDVPGRGNVQIHKGNTHADTLGCILVGSARGEKAITGSKVAFEKWMTEMQDVDEATLVVVDPDA